MLSHELRNPLSSIVNALQLMRLQRGEETILQQQARTILERQVGQLSRLVDDLLEISRVAVGRLRLQVESVELRGIVEMAVEATRSAIERRSHVLTVTVPDSPVWLVADAARLEQVVVNLLDNAAKYTEPGGGSGPPAAPPSCASAIAATASRRTCCPASSISSPRPTARWIAPRAASVSASAWSGRWSSSTRVRSRQPVPAWVTAARSWCACRSPSPAAPRRRPMKVRRSRSWPVA